MNKCEQKIPKPAQLLKHQFNMVLVKYLYTFICIQHQMKFHSGCLM